MSLRKVSKLFTLATMACAALLIAGCGGSDEASTPPVVTPDSSTPSTPATGDQNGLVSGTTAGADGSATGALNTGGVQAEVPKLKGDRLRGTGMSGKNGSFTALASNPDAGGDLMTPVTPDTPEPTTPTMPEMPTPSVPAPTYTGATIYVNGKTHSVNKGDSFPKDNPVFTLVSISESSIELELVSGEFTSGGGSGVFLDKGSLTSLVNSSEQVTYKVKYLRGTTDGLSSMAS